MDNYGTFFKKVIDKAYLEMAKKYCLTSNEIAIVSYLSTHPKNTASDIAANLFFTKSHVSLSVDSLVKKGYLAKERDSCDRKIFHLLLTEYAEPVVRELSMRKQEIEDIFFQDFTDTEKIQLQQSIEKVVHNIMNSNLLR